MLIHFKIALFAAFDLTPNFWSNHVRIYPS